jgi:5'-3' exonuclease
MGASRDTIYIVDASIYVFRAWFSLPNTLTGPDGKPVNAVYGFIRFVTELLEQTRPSHVLFAFDGSLTSSFRNEIYADYKANREPAPPELRAQFELCRSLISALGMRQLVDERFEADDLIATAARIMRERGFCNVIVSSDKDLAQIIEARDVWWNFPKSERLSAEGVRERFGVWPHQITDYLALVGDNVDNIPGVPGIGAKSAGRLLRLYPDLDKLYENIGRVPQLALRGAARIASSLRQHEPQAFKARELVRLVTDVPLECGGDDFGVAACDAAELSRLTGLIGRGDGYVERIREVLRN